MRLVRQTYTKLNPKTGKRETRATAKWYIVYRDHLGKEVKVPGFADRKASEAEGHRLEIQAQRIASGILPEEVLIPPKPLTDHLGDFLASLRAGQGTESHVAQRQLHCERIFAGCGLDSPARIDGEKVRLLLSSWMRREAKPISAQTANHYLASAQHFCEYLRREKVLRDNPIECVERWDAERDRRRVRRVISDEEFDRLIASVRGSPFGRPLAPTSRAILYLTAANSGYRASELQSLRVGKIVRGDRVCLPIPAADAKNRKEETIPLPDFVGKELLAFVRKKSPEDQIWPGTWADSRQAGKMLQRDLDAAGIPYLSGGKYFDFHALRCQYATSLLRAGVPLAYVQKLMRHSTPTLTMNVYAQLGLDDLAAEVSKLDRKGRK